MLPAPNSQFTVIEDVCRRLQQGGFNYMLTGSLALCYFAEPRFTRDLDIVVDLHPGSATSFVQRFEPDYYLDADAIAEAIARRGMFNALHLKEAFKVDFIVRKNTPFHQTEFARRTAVIYDGLPTWITSKEDLILAKLSWAKDSLSDTQLKDIHSLMKSGYDQKYVQEWVANLALESIFQKAQIHA